ncbi:MAG: 4Fe-4S dicluster domain-containing protein [Chloroflexi bacterium]|nr:4Fe-4S dicluster domain-containing protein [Chloroflexota bacterium]
MTVASEIRSRGTTTPSSGPTGPSAWSPLAIADDRCKGCELCIGACPQHVLALDTGVVNPLGYHPIRLTDPAGCTSCALCARVCPDTIFTVYAPRKEA